MRSSKKDPIDILFVHRGRELPDREDVLLSPLGSFYLADYLDKKGIKVRMLNWPLLRYEKERFDIDSFLKDHVVKVVGLDLHWHAQSDNVIKFAQEIKQQHPQIKIVLGGNTAGFFAREILESFSFIDCIIRGDAEVPLLECMDRWRTKDDSLLNISNLVWRGKDQIIFNDHDYACGKQLLETLEYPRFDLLVNEQEQYLAQSASFFIKKPKRMIFYNPGRGCLGACQFCGGGSDIQRLLYNRKGLLWPSLSCVKNTFRTFQGMGIDCVYLPFCCPSLEPFYIALFKDFQINPIGFDVYVETFSLPSPEFISAFRGAFTGELTVVLSPDTGSDALRKKIKTFNYSNEELIFSLQDQGHKGVKTKIFFSTGFADETPQDLLKTIALIRYLKGRFEVELVADSIELEPGSPLYSFPEKHGIRSSRVRFLDFMSAAANFKRSVGYDTRYFKDEEIIANCERLERECSSPKR